MSNKNNNLLLGFLLSLIISTQLSLSKVADSNLSIRLLFVSIIVFIAFILLLFKRNKFGYEIDYVIVPYGLFVIYVFISIIWATSYTVSLFDISRIFIFFTLFLLLNRLIEHYKAHLISALLKSMLLMFFVSLAVFLFNIFLNEESIQILSYKYRGISGHENVYSSFIFLASIGSIYSGFYFNNKWRLISIFALLLQLSVIFFIKTRSVLLGHLVLVVVFSLLLFFKTNIIHRRNIFILSLMLTITLTLFILKGFPKLIKIYLNSDIEQIYGEKVGSFDAFNERMLLWDASYKIIDDNIIKGVGAGNWKIDLNKYSVPKIYKVQDLNVNFQRPHNEYIKILSEYGVIGFVLISFLIFYVLFSLLSIINTKERIYIIILISGILGFLTISFFSFPLERIEHNLLVTILLSISYFHIKLNDSSTFRLSTSLSKHINIFFLVFSFIVVFIATSKIKSSYHIKQMFIAWRSERNQDIIKQCDLALTIFTKIDDYSMPISWYSGNAYARLHSFENAKKDLILAYKSNPYNYHVLNDLGSAYYITNQHNLAIKYYKKASVINPRFDEPKLNLVEVYIKADNYKEAHKWEQTLLHDSKRRDKYRIFLENKLNSN